MAIKTTVKTIDEMLDNLCKETGFEIILPDFNKEKEEKKEEEKEEK